MEKLWVVVEFRAIAVGWGALEDGDGKGDAGTVVLGTCAIGSAGTATRDQGRSVRRVLCLAGRGYLYCGGYGLRHQDLLRRFCAL